jgi:tRNA (Thr-GGU) A37 N-methylase
MFTPREIGFVRSPYTDTKQIPRGLGATHEMDGVLDIKPEFEIGLTDIDGFFTSLGAMGIRSYSRIRAAWDAPV